MSLNIKWINFIRKILYFFITVLILNSVIDSKKIDVEHLAGNYLESQYKSYVIKSIDADRVLFYAGMPFDSIVLSSTISVDEADIIVIQSHTDLDVSSFNGFEELERFVKKNKHVSIMKRKS